MLKTFIPPTAMSSEQKVHGLAKVAELKRQVMEAKSERNHVLDFFESLRQSRYRKWIYCLAEISSDRWNIRYENLSDRERLSIIRTMTELRDLVDDFPKDLTSEDARII
ncbi:DUF5347 domain-containing protein [Enterobacter asburiae]|uniref:DUF5347 domain-containing protein n=1 Tax=Enterobacter asburiae TaxID=61645 RepID=UPI0021CE63E2|nr:DUF5347 domain-containing protein [Enterobacter asburiae]MCU6243870.1 DUF5347 domain-containing protein [Enterobacter asburiae]